MANPSLGIPGCSFSGMASPCQHPGQRAPRRTLRSLRRRLRCLWSRSSLGCRTWMASLSTPSLQEAKGLT
eukprot:9250516-Lingulodinium_polyedra.AAC.1